MKIIYWVSTVIISLFLLLSTISYFFHNGTIEGVRELGFPDFFRIELAVLKIVALIILLVPAIPGQMKEWAYAGVALFYLTAIIAHVAHGDSPIITLINIVLILLLMVSNHSFHKMFVPNT